MTLPAIAILPARAFAVGLHDAPDAIATLVATRAARPRHALAPAACLKLLGPLLVGGAVAKAIAPIEHHARPAGLHHAARTPAVTAISLARRSTASQSV